jgi:C-terminal, D2-small domain, of ClpB protein
MKATNLLLYLLCIVGALAGFCFLAPPLSWCAVAGCAAFAVWTLLASERASATVLRFAGLPWSMEDFVRGWLITGRTGSGKTQCAINTITYQVFQNVPNWGGICLDQKGLYWENLVKMAGHFSRERDLVLLQTRPLGKDELWRPANTINITGDHDVPASTYSKVIVDTAASLAGGRGQNPFFPIKAQIAIQTGFEILRLPFTTLERAVISELHRFCRPELIGRFGEKIVFKPLSQDTQREIGCLAISEELDRFKERGFNLTVSEAAFEFLVRRGIQKTLGARPMKKTVQKFIGDAIRESLKAGTPPSGTLAVSPLNDRLVIQ